jgi:flagellar P-ring protein FlgI
MKKIILVIIFIIFNAQPILAVRVKDLVEIQGVRENKLTGYGLVVGLNGTGDKSSLFTIQSLANMLRNMGIQVNPALLKVKNVAAVMITSSLPPFAKSTQKLDCTVSSVGDSSSLAGGTLITAPLYGPDGKVYALAQGAISVGGFSVSGGSGSSVTKNIPTVGLITSGAIVERSLDVTLGPQMTLVMDNPDFTTTHRLVGSINEKLGTPAAHASDLSTVLVDVPDSYKDRIVDFVSVIENVDVVPDNRARIIVNERTGTVVMGSDVKIASVAIAYGNLSIRISEESRVSQPLPFSKTGQTVVTPQSGVEVKESGKRIVMLPKGASVGDLVSAVNAIGVSPRDLVVILQCIKKAGALYADLEII